MGTHEGAGVTGPEITDLEAMVARLARLEEAELARNLLHAYAEVLDDPAPEAVAALFTEDGVLSVPAGDLTGRDEIAGFYRSRLEADPSEKRHFITSPRTRTLAPGLVQLASYFAFTARGASASGLGWGSYLDVVAVADGTALFRHKTITPHVSTDLARGWAAG